MSSMRKVFWRGGLALALVPVALGLVAASPAPADAKATWKFEFGKAERQRQLEERRMELARQLEAGQLRDLHVEIALAGAKAEQALGKSAATVRIVRERAAQPRG
jgi:ATP-dependent protease HslVU (ClpYQ) ATPase subunit